MNPKLLPIVMQVLQIPFLKLASILLMAELDGVLVVDLKVDGNG